MTKSIDSNSEHEGQDARNKILRPGTIIPSEKYPGEFSIVIEDLPKEEEKVLINEEITREWEYIHVSRPVDIHEKIYEVPTVRHVQTVLPKIDVHEVVKTIHKPKIEYVDKEVEIPHVHHIDKYVEVPVICGSEVKYVPKVEVRERTIKTVKPEIQWIEKIVEVPQIKEVVRYVESDDNVERVTRYMAKRSESEELRIKQSEEMLSKHEETLKEEQEGEGSNDQLNQEDNTENNSRRPVTHQPFGANSPRLVSLSQAGSNAQVDYSTASPRLEKTEQLFIPRLFKTIEIEKEVQVNVDVPVPFMAPKTVIIPVEVPVYQFRNHFVPVPVRRHVTPKVTFTDDVYQVECKKEKPILVIEDYYKPVAIDVQVKLKEKDIKINPIDPSELSQADMHAMWMRVNADLYEHYKSFNSGPAFETDAQRQFMAGSNNQSDTQKENAEGTNEGYEEANAENVMQSDETKLEANNEFDPSHLPFDIGPLPLHPGHPLMMTYLQNQWMQIPSTFTHNMYTPEFLRLHASALDSILHPQPHQVNITEEQSELLGPLPAEQMPSPWIHLKVGVTGERTPRYKDTESVDSDLIREEEIYQNEWMADKGNPPNVCFSSCCSP